MVSKTYTSRTLARSKKQMGSEGYGLSLDSFIFENQIQSVGPDLRQFITCKKVF